jgi:hypothetical protein
LVYYRDPQWPPLNAIKLMSRYGSPWDTKLAVFPVGEDRRVLTVRNQATGDMSLADPDHAGRIGFVPARL